MQYRGRMQGLASNHPEAERSIILAGEVAAGWMVVDRSGEAIHVVDIAILSEHRGAGAGSAAIGTLLDESDRTGRAVVLEVFAANPAQRLYERLGFRKTGGNEVQNFLRRDPAGV